MHPCFASLDQGMEMAAIVTSCIKKDVDMQNGLNMDSYLNGASACGHDVQRIFLYDELL